MPRETLDLDETIKYRTNQHKRQEGTLRTISQKKKRDNAFYGLHCHVFVI